MDADGSINGSKSPEEIEAPSGRASRPSAADTTTTTPNIEVLEADPPGRYMVLAVMTLSVVFGLVTWFSATAVRYDL